MESEIISCPACARRLIVPVQYSGKRARCSQCQQTIPVPNFNSFEFRMSKKKEIYDPHLFSAYVRCFDFTGRSRRKELWLFILCSLLELGGIFILYLILNLLSENAAFGFLSTAMLFIAVLNNITALSLAIRRAHDVGHGFLWVVLLYIIPFCSILLSIILLFRDSEATENKWGPCPK